jgi:hypothetical protein
VRLHRREQLFALGVGDALVIVERENVGDDARPFAASDSSQMSA